MDYGAVVWGTVALVLVGTVPSVARAQQAPAVAPSLVFDGATVVDVEQGTLVPNQRVVIAGNRIRAMGPRDAVKTPQGAQVVDAHGKYLIPGLWDLHTHAGRSTDLFYPLFLANGVTGIRDAGSPVPLDTLLLWRREVLAGTRVGPPRQLLSGQSVAGPASIMACNPEAGPPPASDSPQTCVLDSAAARQYVDSLHAAGADMIKPRAVSREFYFVLAAEARRLGIPFGGHTEGATALEASDSGAGILDHMDTAGDLDARCLWSVPPTSLDFAHATAEAWGHATLQRIYQASVEACQPVAERFQRNGTWWVPTMGMSERALMLGLCSAPIAARLTARAAEEWTYQGNWIHEAATGVCEDSTAGLLYIAQRVGLPVLAGTDVVGDMTNARTLDMGTMLPGPPGFALHAELAMYVAEGLTPAAALRTATLNPARFLHATDSLGTVAVGKLADLVLLDADPLADIANTTMIRAVVANGRYFDRAALDGLLADAQTKEQQAGSPTPPP